MHTALNCLPLLQGEKVKLKEKAESDKAFQTKASISIPLVDEHPDDVKNAKKISFNADSSLTDRRRKRLEVKTQSVFSSAGPSPSLVGSPKEPWEKDRVGTKKAHTILMQARSKAKGGGAFASPSSHSHQPTRLSSVDRTKQLRNSLGVKTAQK